MTGVTWHTHGDGYALVPLAIPLQGWRVLRDERCWLPAGATPLVCWAWAYGHCGWPLPSCGVGGVRLACHT